uniref:Uncharacterized protein n=1 Tax=Anguilla anguilla TaxID=7936 RepID=A0A0E9P7H8_ANGAN
MVQIVSITRKRSTQCLMLYRQNVYSIYTLLSSWSPTNPTKTFLSTC